MKKMNLITSSNRQRNLRESSGKDQSGTKKNGPIHLVKGIKALVSTTGLIEHYINHPSNRVNHRAKHRAGHRENLW